jgi:hypothetical protein
MAYVLGARGLVLLAVVMIALFPVMMVSSAIVRRLLPPTLIFSDEYLEEIKSRT